MPSFKLKIDGRDRQFDDVDPTLPLLWVLRDQLGWVGARFGCGKALCVASSVHINGIPGRTRFGAPTALGIATGIFDGIVRWQTGLGE